MFHQVLQGAASIDQLNVVNIQQPPPAGHAESKKACFS